MLLKNEIRLKIYQIFGFIGMMLLVLMLFGNGEAYASQTEIILEEAQTDNGDGYVQVNVSIKADSNIGTYGVELKYDTDRLEYVSGAESELDGIITLEGTGFGKEVTYKLLFTPVSGGQAGIAVSSAYIFAAGTDGEAYTIEELPVLYVDIAGKDSAGTVFNNNVVQFAGALQDGDRLLRIIDIADYEIPTELWDYKIVTDSYNDGTFTFLTDNARNIRVILTMDESGNVFLYAYRADTGNYYVVNETYLDGETYYIMSQEACLNTPDEMSDAEKNDATIFYGINKAGDGNYYRYSTDGRLCAWSPAIQPQDNSGIKITPTIILPIVIAFIIVTVAVLTVIFLKRRKFSLKPREKFDLFNGKIDDKKQYFFVVRELTAREIKRKYARSYLGILWSVLNPLLTMAVMSVIFSYMFKRSIDNYALYFLTGNIFWTLFSVATNSAMTALVDNKMLLVKAKLPKQTFVLSRVYTSLVNFGYTCIAYLFMLLVFRIRPSWTMLFFIPDVILALLFATGIGYLLSILYVFFADIKYLYSVALTLLLYMSAIFYPVSSLPPVVKNVIGFNPIYLMIYIAREAVVYNHVPHYTAWLKLLLAAVVSMGLGLLVFKKKENDVMQRI